MLGILNTTRKVKLVQNYPPNHDKKSQIRGLLVVFAWPFLKKLKKNSHGGTKPVQNQVQTSSEKAFEPTHLPRSRISSKRSSPP